MPGNWNNAFYIGAFLHSPCISRGADFQDGWPVLENQSLQTCSYRKKVTWNCMLLRKLKVLLNLPLRVSGSLNPYYFYTAHPNRQFSWRRGANQNHICPDTCRQLLGKGPWLLMEDIISLSGKKHHADLRPWLLSLVSSFHLIHPKSKPLVYRKGSQTHTPKLIVQVNTSCKLIHLHA